MKPRTPAYFLVAAIIFAAALFLGAFAPRTERAHAGVDISGQWELSFTGVVSGACEGVILQSGASLQSYAYCDIVGDGVLAGTIDLATRAFTLSGDFSGIPVSLSGAASADGNTITGTWNALGFGGTFTAIRVGPVPELVDLTGPWDLLLLGTEVDLCHATFTQTDTDLALELTCDTIGAGSLTGTINPFTGNFLLSGHIGGQLIDLFGSYFAFEGFETKIGVWFEAEDFGMFIGGPPGAFDTGVVGLACGEFFLEDCYAEVGETFELQAHVLLPPAAGATGIQGKFAWFDDPSGALSAGGTAQEAPNCEPAVSIPEQPPEVFTCLYPEGAELTGPVATYQLRCEQQGYAGLYLTPRDEDPILGTFFSGGNGEPIDPLFVDTSAYCYQEGACCPDDGGQLGGGGESGGPDTPRSPPIRRGPRPSAAPTTQPPAPTATPGSQVLALPSTGAAAPGGSDALIPALLGAGGALAFAAGWRLRRLKAHRR